MKQRADNTEYIFVVETCQNCKEHHWNTRHDETKYEDFFNRGNYDSIITSSFQRNN